MSTHEKLQTLENEEQEKQIRERLNRDKVKLWEPPHTKEDGSKGEIPAELVAQYSTDLQMSPDVTTAVLERLREHAVTKLAARNKFQKTGIATLKAKIIGCIPETAKKLFKNPYVSIEIDLNLNGSDLKNQICELATVGIIRLKVISGGRVIDDDKSLQQQGLKNQAVVMALFLSDSEVAARKKQETAARVVRTRAAAQLLSDKEDDGVSKYLHVADQAGNKLTIPPQEHKALLLAMTLHEKARSAIRRQDYGEALLLLLESDAEFKRCNSKLLNSVDNYALVCLDVVWCYLSLKSLRDLPDAEQRLVMCSDCLQRSYGKNLERLEVVKGETGIERALFMRLHLLQAIIAFHQGHFEQANLLLDKAEGEMEELRVDEASMTSVMKMGFSALDARLALRACKGNVPSAVSHIVKKLEDRKQRAKKEAKEKKIQRVQKTLGRTADGNKLNVETYKLMLSMGFTKGAVAEALRQSNNEISLALQMLQENPELLELPDPSEKVPITDALVAQVIGMGFTESAARVALAAFDGDVQRAVMELLKHNGEAQDNWTQDTASTSTSSYSSSSSSSSSSTGSRESTSDERELEKLAYDEITSDIAEDEEAFLDFTLVEETDFLHEYRALLSSRK